MVVAICNWTSDVFQPLFLGFEPAATVVEESHTAQTTTRVITAVNIALIMFLQVSLKSSYADLHVGGSLAAIEDHTRCPKFLHQSLRAICALRVIISSRLTSPVTSSVPR